MALLFFNLFLRKLGYELWINNSRKTPACDPSSISSLYKQTLPKKFLTQAFLEGKQHDLGSQMWGVRRAPTLLWPATSQKRPHHCGTDWIMTRFWLLLDLSLCQQWVPCEIWQLSSCPLQSGWVTGAREKQGHPQHQFWGRWPREKACS